MDRSFRPLTLLATLPAIALGVAVAHVHGQSWHAYVPNLVAVALGSLVVVATALQRSPANWNVATLLAPLAVLLTLGLPGIQGVHRWITLGPVRLHASVVALPWLLGALSSHHSNTRSRVWLLLCATQLLHIVQPDAGQATLCAVGAVPLLATDPRLTTRTRVGLALFLLAACAVAWTRPDPLAPVDLVERVLVRLNALGVGWMLLGVLSVLSLVLPWVMALPEQRLRPLASSLFFVQLLGFVVPMLGNFPVPLMGAGAGPVLGWYCALAVLQHARRDESRKLLEAERGSRAKESALDSLGK